MHPSKYGPPVMMVREAELIERRLNVLGDLLIQARMADENGRHRLLPDRSNSI